MVAFARSFRETTLLVLAGRFFAQLERRSPASRLDSKPGATRKSFCASNFPAGPYRDVFTGRTLTPVRRNGNVILPLADAFAHLPIALLVS